MNKTLVKGGSMAEKANALLFGLGDSSSNLAKASSFLKSNLLRNSSVYILNLN
jgi:hypothetical protein